MNLPVLLGSATDMVEPTEVGQNVPATRATVPAVTVTVVVLSSYAIVPAVGAMAPAGTRMHPEGLDAPEPPEPVLGIPGHELSKRVEVPGLFGSDAVNPGPAPLRQAWIAAGPYGANLAWHGIHCI